jgi:hypothetical protein
MVNPFEKVKQANWYSPILVVGEARLSAIAVETWCDTAVSVAHAVGHFFIYLAAF